MTHPRNAQHDSTTLDQIMELLTQDGPDAMAQALTTLLNHAMRIERVVIDEVRGLAKDKALLAQVLADAHAAVDGELAGLRRERDDLRHEAKRHDAELRKLASDGTASPDVTGRIADLHQRIAEAERRLPELDAAIASLERETVTQAEAEAAFADFDQLWENMIPREQARLLKLLLTSVDYDGDTGTVSVTFRSTSIRSLIKRKLEDAA